MTYDGLRWDALISPAWWAWNVAQALPFYLATLAATFAAWGSVRFLAPRARDGGWAMSRLLALVVPAWAVWFVSGVFEVDAGRAIVWVVPLLLFAAAIPWLRAPRETAAEVAALWRPIAVREGIVLVVFAAAIGVRSQSPAITWVIADHAAEKFTDMAMLAANWATSSFPPEDPWFAGHPVNYYTFGHWWWAMWMRLLGVAPNVGYNVALCLGFAMAAMLTFAFLDQATGRALPSLGVAAALAAGGNLLAVQHLVRDAAARGGWTEAAMSYDLWAPSRAITDTITEFPAFSFLLGDLHAHTHGYLLVLGLLLWAATVAVEHPARFGPRAAPTFLELLPAAFLLGAMGATNSWDLISCTIALGVVAPVVYAAPGEGARGWARAGRAAVASGAVAVLAALGSILFFGYFWRHFHAPPPTEPAAAGSILEAVSPLRWVTDPLRSRPREFLAHWGFPLALLAACLPVWGVPWLRRVWAGATASSHGAWRLAAHGLAVAAGVTWIGCTFPRREIDGGLAHIGWIVLGTVFAAAVLPRLFAWESPRGRFGAGLLLAACALVMMTEVVYLDDIFSGGFARINTVFKVYYPLWPIVGAAALVLLVQTRDEVASWRWPWRSAGVAHGAANALLAVAIVAWIVGGAFYTVAAVMARSHQAATVHAATGRTLDGWAFAAVADEAGVRDDYALIRRLREEVPPPRRPRVLEAVDGTYCYASRFATNLGWVAWMGWEQHTASWRGGTTHQRIDQRRTITEDLYLRAGAEQWRQTLNALDIDVVFYGKLEWDLYGEDRFPVVREALTGWREVSEGTSYAWVRAGERAVAGP